MTKNQQFWANFYSNFWVSNIHDYEQEKLEKKKAEYVEKKRNKIALIHKAAEEKKAAIEAKRKEDLLMAEEIATTYRTTETSPRKLLNCFTS